MLCLTLGKHVVGWLYPVPSIVSVHGIEAAADRSDSPLVGPGQGFLRANQRRKCAARWRVTAVQKRMQIDSRRAVANGELYHRDNLIFVAVNAAGRHEPEYMQRRIRLDGLLYGTGQHRVAEECLFLYVFVDTGQALVHNPARAQIHMAYLGVAHLPSRQAYRFSRGIDEGVGPVLPQRIPHRAISTVNSIAAGLFSIAPAIQN